MFITDLISMISAGCNIIDEAAHTLIKAIADKDTGHVFTSAKCLKDSE